MKKFLFVALFAFALAHFPSCSSTVDQTEQNETEKVPADDSQIESGIEGEDENEQIEEVWALYEGTLGLYEQQVVMELRITGDQVSGNYFYAKHQKLIQLSGTFDEDKQLVKVTESYKGKPTGYLEFYVEKGELTGKWMKKSGASEKENFSAELVPLSKENYKLELQEYENPHVINVYNGATEEDEQMEVTDELKMSKLGKGFFAFYYSVTGGNAHMGTVEGLGETSGGTSYFEGEDACRLEFKFNNKTLVVTEAKSCSYYRGAHAYFDGTLTKKR